MSIFKRTRAPFYHNLLTDDNTAYCCSITGSDDNPGTRDLPFRSISKALEIQKMFVCINDGVYSIEENYSAVWHYIVFADKDCAVIKGKYYTYDHYIYNVHLEKVVGDNLWSSATTGIQNCFVKEFDLAKKNLYYSRYNYINNFISRYIGLYLRNFTITNFKNNFIQGDGILQDHIFINEIDLFRYNNQNTNVYPVFKHCLFRKSLKWSWNGDVIPVTYSGNKENWISDLKEALRSYGINNLTATDQEYLLTIVENSFSKSNIIHDDINDTHIFNKYDIENNPIDVTLFLDNNNPALYMSTTGSFVGAFSPNLKMEMEEISNICEDGTYDPTIGGTLLVYNSNEGSYGVDPSSYQKWNRVRSKVIKPNFRNFSFSGIQGALDADTNNRYYFGKRQQFDDNNFPVETIEVIPYDDESTVADFPKFSCSLTEDTHIWFHKEGGPILFEHLEGMGITSKVDHALYGGYAVTTADINSKDLMVRTDCIAKNIEIKYFQLEVNFHFSE